MELQPARSLAENLADLSVHCNVGCKRNGKGHQESRIGYKLHLDTVDGETVPGTQRQRTGEQFAQRTLWRPLGAGRGQSDVPFDVRVGGPDGHRALRAIVLKPAKPTASHWRPRYPQQVLKPAHWKPVFLLPPTGKAGYAASLISL